MLGWWLFMLDRWKPCLSPAVLKKSANIPCSPRVLLGLPTITSILRRISVVRSSNTKKFSDIYSFLTFHQLWVIWEKSVKGELSVLFSFATRAFFQEMVNSLFPLFPDFFFFFFFWSVLGVFEAVLTLQRACYD